MDIRIQKINNDILLDGGICKRLLRSNVYVVAILLSQNTQIVNELVHGYGFPTLLYDLRVIAFHAVGDHGVHHRNTFISMVCTRIIFYAGQISDQILDYLLCRKKKCGVHLAK